MGKVQFGVAFSISCMQWQSQHHAQFLFGRKKGEGGLRMIDYFQYDSMKYT